MPAKESLIGQRFGKLKVIADAPRYFYKGGNQAVSECLCDCGNTRRIKSNSLKRGETKSCGCLIREATIRRNTTHGRSHTRLYRVWRGMIERCTDPNHKAFNNYGGRGIQVCERWKSFTNFFEDMGHGKKGWTLERVHNDGNYGWNGESFNCVWATQIHQSRNTRTNVVMTVRGITGCITALAEHFNIKPSIVFQRLYHGWEAEKAFTDKPSR